jgi:hypothetical protein
VVINQCKQVFRRAVSSLAPLERARTSFTELPSILKSASG